MRGSSPLTIPFFLQVIFGSILFLLSLLDLLKSQLHFLVLFGEFFNGGCKGLDLLGQGC